MIAPLAFCFLIVLVMLLGGGVAMEGVLLAIQRPLSGFFEGRISNQTSYYKLVGRRGLTLVRRPLEIVADRHLVPPLLIPCPHKIPTSKQISFYLFMVSYGIGSNLVIKVALV
jgi:hypothetical protein